jgi:hypothetical protein
MSLRNAVPYKFKPRGTSDTLDGMNSPPGAMSSLQNLVPDISTPFAFQCRPAETSMTTFSGFTTPGNVSWANELNGVVYGLVSSGRNVGFDEPFAFNIGTSTFLTVSGITAGNVPATQDAVSAWNPPSSAINGPYIVFTHPGFTGTNGYFGFFDVSSFTETSPGNITSGSDIITGDFPIAGIQPGYVVTGAGITAGSRVVNVANVSGSTTGNTNSSTSLTSVVALIPIGSQITGVGILAGTTVTAVSGSAGNYTVTISQAATATATGITLFYTGTTITISTNATATTAALSITIAGGTTSAPLWSSGNTTMNGLTGVPTFVNLFFGRFYFAVEDELEYTDTLSLNRTVPSQAITIGDSTPVTALSLFTLTTTSQGILQGLLAFKSNTIFQVTGDESLNTLAVNALNTAAGTIAPGSVAPTPSGVFFMAPDGIRVVQVDGTVSEPDQDIQLPFINALVPSRVNAGYNSDVYRICVQNDNKPGAPWEEYWYDLAREIWTGPHSCQDDVIIPYLSTFICFSHLQKPNMFMSYVTQVVGSSFTEYGSLLIWDYATSPIGEDDSMLLNSMNETTVNISLPPGGDSVVCTASDETNGVLSTATIIAPTGGTVWGFFIWGAALWGASAMGIRPHTIPWTIPLVFTKLIFKATSSSSSGLKISNLRFMLQPANYFPPV